jgi:hypothetical protein
MNFNVKEAFNFLFGSAELDHEKLKKIRNSLGQSFSTFSVRFSSFRFDFDLVRIKFESFTVIIFHNSFIYFKLTIKKKQWKSRTFFVKRTESNWIRLNWFDQTESNFLNSSIFLWVRFDGSEFIKTSKYCRNSDSANSCLFNSVRFGSRSEKNFAIVLKAN